jgi:uncharacterized phiE125 gp8 family phage protein
VSLTLIQGPEVEPVSLAEARMQCRVDDDNTAEDALLESFITAAREMCEHELGRALISQTWEVTLDAFPSVEIELPKPDVLAVTSVAYIGPDLVEATVPSNQYVLDAATPPAWLLPAAGTAWPAAVQGTTNAVRVRFTAGFGPAASDVPESIKSWIKLQVAALYKHREAFASGHTVAELPNRFTGALLDRYRMYF